MIRAAAACAAAAAAAAAAPGEWVAPQGLPDGHNGGVMERLVAPAAGTQPHLLFILFDDYGWADAGWHRNYTAPGGAHVPATDEVQTPNLDALVREGIELDRAYVYKYCSPTRSAIQSGRNPYHVNPLNLAPDVANRADPVSGFAAIPRNMTGVATKLAAAGYTTAMFGKWDAGMATADHTPGGRGYHTALHYFHHANDYWSMTTGGCADTTPVPPAPPLDCAKGKHGGFCLGASPNLHSDATRDAGDCCALCAAADGCAGWAWGRSYHAASGNHSCFLKSAVVGSDKGNCTSACRDGGTRACMPKKIPVVDLWRTDGGTGAPALGLNNTCVKGNPMGGHPDACVPGAEGDKWWDGYEDALFEQHVLDTVNGHDASTPLFIFWAHHVVHAPLQVPQEYIDKFSMIEPTDKPSGNRQVYHAMVNFADAAVGNVTAALKRKGMWDDLLIVFSTDNGGPIYYNGSAGANNYPLKGGKMNNWEGGIRGNSFVSGGFLPAARRGTKYESLVTAWDWYATFCSFAGVDATDHRAALAGLPPIDSHDLSAVVMGTNLTSPRTELPIGTEPRASNLTSAPLCSSYNTAAYYGDEERGDAAPAAPAAGRCTTVSGVIVDEGAGGLWKLLTGDVQQDMYTGPHYPNDTTNEVSNNFVGHCAQGCLFNLRDDPLEAHDLAAAMPAKAQELYAKIEGYEQTAFNPHRGGTDPAACAAAQGPYGGFWGPFIE